VTSSRIITVSISSSSSSDNPSRLNLPPSPARPRAFCPSGADHSTASSPHRACRRRERIAVARSAMSACWPVEGCVPNRQTQKRSDLHGLKKIDPRLNNFGTWEKWDSRRTQLKHPRDCCGAAISDQRSRVPVVGSRGLAREGTFHPSESAGIGPGCDSGTAVPAARSGVYFTGSWSRNRTTDRSRL